MNELRGMKCECWEGEVEMNGWKTMLLHRIKERKREREERVCAFFKVKIEILRIDFHLHSLMKRLFALSLNGLIINTTANAGKEWKEWRWWRKVCWIGCEGKSLLKVFLLQILSSFSSFPFPMSFLLALTQVGFSERRDTKRDFFIRQHFTLLSPAHLSSYLHISFLSHILSFPSRAPLSTICSEIIASVEFFRREGEGENEGKVKNFKQHLTWDPFSSVPRKKTFQGVAGCESERWGKWRLFLSFFIFHPLPSLSLSPSLLASLSPPRKEGTNVQGQQKLRSLRQKMSVNICLRRRVNIFGKATSSPGHDIAFGPEVQVVETLPLVSFIHWLTHFTLLLLHPLLISSRFLLHHPLSIIFTTRFLPPFKAILSGPVVQRRKTHLFSSSIFITFWTDLSWNWTITTEWEGKGGE